MPQRLLLESSQFRCEAGLWTGQHHTLREDRLVLAIKESTLMVAVLDGMGGLPHAREAAATAGTAVLETWHEGIT